MDGPVGGGRESFLNEENYKFISPNCTKEVVGDYTSTMTPKCFTDGYTIAKSVSPVKWQLLTFNQNIFSHSYTSYIYILFKF